jgi:two-component system sensor histidine kinase ChiS
MTADLPDLTKLPEPKTTKRILVVDDETAARVLISTFLDRGGFEAVKAKNGKEALIVMEQGPLPDLVICDVMMPEMDGVTLVRQIRHRFPETHIPILVLSGSGDVQTVNDALSAGANDFLSKPILRHDLVEKIKTALKLS